MIRIYTSRLSQSTVWVNSISSNNAPAKPPSALLPSQSPQFALTKPDKFVPTVQWLVYPCNFETVFRDCIHFKKIFQLNLQNILLANFSLALMCFTFFNSLSYHLPLQSTHVTRSQQCKLYFCDGGGCSGGDGEGGGGHVVMV